MEMNCEQFRACWSEWHAGRLDADTAAACAAERDRCRACACYDRQMRSLVLALGELPLPAADRPPSPAVRAGRRPGRRWSAPALAAAAGLVLAFAAGVLVSLPSGDRIDGAVVEHAGEPVRIAVDDVERIHLAFASAREIESVEFTIELPSGVELEGHPGERVITWSGRLRQGRSRLTLPVRIGRDLEAGEALIARIRHADGEHALRIPLEPDAGRDGEARSRDDWTAGDRTGRPAINT